MNELIDAHAVDLSEPPCLDRDGRSYEQDDLVDICLGLIETVTAKDDNGQPTIIVRIAHFSVQEYLQSDRILQQNSRVFAMQSETGNTKMALICLVYLIEPGLSRGPLDETKLRLFPFAHFAATHWFHHYTYSGEGKETIEALALKLFKDDKMAFVTWRWLHDMDRPWRTDWDFPLRINDTVSPLYYAALLGLELVSNSILPIDTGDRGADINAQGGRLGNALQAASYGGHENVVQMLLDQGADINAQGGRLGNALQTASYGGHENVVQMLLDQDADVNAQGGDLSNALQAASYGGHETVVQMLLDRGADVNAQGGHYGNALQSASDGGHETVVQILLDRGADINAQGGQFGNALQAASYGGHETVVQILLDRGADINAQGGQFGNALQAASYGGHETVVQVLLDRGADINAQGGEYSNALQAASFRGYENVVHVLVDRGAALHARDSTYGITPLSWAVEGGHDVVVKLFLSTNKDCANERDNCGRTPLFYAAWYGHEAVAQAILNDNSVDPDQKDHYGSTPLSIAVRHAHVDVVRVLLATGIVIYDSHDRFGRSVFWWAKRSGNADIEKMLMDYAWMRGIPMRSAEHVDGRPIRRGRPWRVCDVCTLDIPDDNTYYRCGVCNGGDFDVCLECYELEGRCLQDDHVLNGG
jgi:ankyrin repeat protein